MQFRSRRRASFVDTVAHVELLEPRYLLAAPIAIDDQIAVGGNESRDVGFILANDSDPDGDALTILSTDTPQHGILETVNGRLLYTPNTDYAGDDSFGYIVQDTGGSTAAGMVHISVNTFVDINAARAQILAGVGSELPNPLQPTNCWSMDRPRSAC